VSHYLPFPRLDPFLPVCSYYYSSLINYTFCVIIIEKGQKEIMDNREEWRADLLWNPDKGRICDYCGINMDIPWLDILMFFHEDCWKKYRKDDKIYPMPKYA
jgi:hypothetical protein